MLFLLAAELLAAVVSSHVDGADWPMSANTRRQCLVVSLTCAGRLGSVPASRLSRVVNRCFNLAGWGRAEGHNNPTLTARPVTSGSNNPSCTLASRS